MDSMNPKCVGSTNDDYNVLLTSNPTSNREVNFFRSALFTPDGTTLLTHTQDQTLRAFILPTDLLSPPSSSPPHHHLKPYTALPHPNPLRTFTPHPTFSLSSPLTTLILSAGSDTPIRLSNVFSTTSPSSLQDQTVLPTMTPISSYSFIDPMNETYTRPNSLLFTPGDNGAHFLVGAENALAVFDVEYSKDPLSVERVPKRAKRKGGGWRGVVNALDVQHEGGLLAAGTTERDVMLYEREGLGRCAAVWNVGHSGERADVSVKGKGVTSLKWSPCGTFLLVAERGSDVVQVWDVRNLGRRIGLLTGRNAGTLQRLGMDVGPTEKGFEVWAGGRDGVVRMWENAGDQEGECEPDYEVKLHEDAVSSAVWHPLGSVLATCSGQRLQSMDFDSDDGSSSSEDSTSTERISSIRSKQSAGLDNSLKVWTL